MRITWVAAGAAAVLGALTGPSVEAPSSAPAPRPATADSAGSPGSPDSPDSASSPDSPDSADSA